jgi:hypothetical protein
MARDGKVMASQSEPQMIPALLIDSIESLDTFLQDLIEAVHSQTPTLYVDLEGIRLSRNGSVSLLTLLIHSNGKPDRVYLVDIHTLGALAFTMVSNLSTDTEIRTLKDVLENRRVPKVFFDVRNDSDALFSHFDIRMKGIIDLQLMENASRHTGVNGKRFLAVWENAFNVIRVSRMKRRKFGRLPRIEAKGSLLQRKVVAMRLSTSAPCTMISRSIVSRMYDFYPVSTRFTTRDCAKCRKVGQERSKTRRRGD